jgi:cobalt-zinc-cadmium resistance protein CzcA
MIEKIIAWSIKNRLMVGLLTLALIITGLWSMKKVPIDAVPDITNNQVQVITQAPRLGTEDIEQFVTYPVELAMANLPEVKEIRSVSRFGLSVVTIVFNDDAGTYLPRQLVTEKLMEVQEAIPEGFGKPSLGPISTGLGEVYQYTLKVDSNYINEYSHTDLRSIQDWIIKRQMAMVEGVVEVNAFGGSIKQYEVAVDPNVLKSMGLTINDLLRALKANNENSGGAYIEKNHQANFIRGEGLARSIEDIEKIVVSNVKGLPITIKDIAKVQFGEAVRYGALTKDGQGETVGGMILMLKGANSNEVITAVKRRMEEIQESLPPGIQIEAFLDRSSLIAETTGTVSQNLIEGALIVIFVLVLLLGNWRGGLIVASTIPLSLLFAFILMHLFGVWANLMSLGAIDFGIIIDGAVIIVESSVFLLHEKLLKGKLPGKEEQQKVVLKASSNMMNSAFFGQLIILVVFIPILALEGVEGKMFQPMALTFSFAMLGVMLLCLTYVPMMTASFLRVKPGKATWGDRFISKVERLYDSMLSKAMHKSKWVIALALLLLSSATFLFSRLGGEFIPQLDEGDIAFHIILKGGSALSETISYTTKVERLIKEKFPEAEHVISRIGVADVPTDPMPMDIADCFIILKHRSEWVSAQSKEELIEKIKTEVEQIPGINYEFTQPIEMRFNELLTGVREDIAIKIFGEDLDILSNKAEEMGKIIAPIQGVADMRVEATRGLPQLNVRYDRNKLAQYGLDISSLNILLQTAYAGGKAGVIFEGEKRFDLVVRLSEEHRKGLESLRELFVPLPNGAQVPLKEVAQISYEPGPMQISRDNTNRRVYVGINVRGRDVESLVEEIRTKLETQLELPPGYYLRYGGAFENLERATKRLKLVVPIALGLIFLFIFLALNSFKQSLMIYMAIPLAAIGGVFSLWLRDLPFSISAGVGFIVLFGVAVLNGLVLISSWNDLKNEKELTLNDRIRQGAKRRIRPILLTALTDIFGFLPMAISNSAGAEVQRPLATVVIGGMISATLLTLFILPLLYRWMETSRKHNIKTSIVTPCLLIFLGITLTPLKAQETSTPIPIALEEALKRGKADYPSIRVKQLEIEQQEAQQKTAWNLGQTTVYTSGEEISKEVEGVRTLIGLQQQNMNLLGIPSQQKLQKEKLLLARDQLQLSELNLALEIKSTYAQLYVQQQLYELSATLDSSFKEFEKAAKLRYETGESSQLAYLAAANQAGKMSNEKNKAYYNYLLALQAFNTWFLSDSIFTIEQSFSLDTIALRPIDNMEVLHPSISVESRKVSRAEQAVKVAQSNYLPKFSIQYGIQEVGGQSGYYQYQAGISFPLFYNKEKAGVQTARLSQAIAEQQLLENQLLFEREYQQALAKYKKWSASWKYFSKQALVLAKKQRLAALLAYQEGEIDYISFLHNIRDAIAIEQEAWYTYEGFLLSKFQLEYYTLKN